jgi:hypothetical protein
MLLNALRRELDRGHAGPGKRTLVFWLTLNTVGSPPGTGVPSSVRQQRIVRLQNATFVGDCSPSPARAGAVAAGVTVAAVAAGAAAAAHRQAVVAGAEQDPVRKNERALGNIRGPFFLSSGSEVSYTPSSCLSPPAVPSS